jgi:hypothetical protein
MQFTEQTIVIFNRYHMQQSIDAMVNGESGLGYYETTEGITVTTVNSGYAVTNLWNHTTIFNAPLAYNEQVAQRFIEIIAPLLDWTKSHTEIMEQAKFCYGDVQAVKPHIRKAFSDACEQVTVVETSK